MKDLSEKIEALNKEPTPSWYQFKVKKEYNQKIEICKFLEDIVKIGKNIEKVKKPRISQAEKNHIERLWNTVSISQENQQILNAQNKFRADHQATNSNNPRAYSINKPEDQKTR